MKMRMLDWVKVFGIINVVINVHVTVSCNSNVQNQQLSIKALPSASQGWKSIICKNRVYVDKTKYLREMLRSDQTFWLLTRPRRFSKSVFLQMAYNFFRGKAELFKGLDIYNDGNTKFFNASQWDKTYDSAWFPFPVLHLDFNDLCEFEHFDEFKLQYRNMLAKAVRRCGIDKARLTCYSLSDIIDEVYTNSNKLPVMILIDEYDKPFYEAKYMLKNDDLADKIAMFLDASFSGMKSRYGAGQVGFVFVTGVSRLGIKIMESGANVFEDITYDSVYNDAFGFTENEIRFYFKDSLLEFAREKNYLQKNNKSPEDQILNDLQNMYDGYRFDIKNNSASKIFNPVSLIQCLRHKQLAQFWCATSSVQYAVERFYNESRQWHLQTFIDGFRIEERDIVARNPLKTPSELPVYMLTYGYLTVKNYYIKTKEFTLKFPNTEIREYFKEQLSAYSISQSQLPESADELKVALNDGNIECAIQIIKKKMFFVRPNRYATAAEIDNRIHDVLHLAGIQVQEKVLFKKDKKRKHDGGDIDHMTIGLRYNYVMSLKCGQGSALDAIEQLINYTREDPDEFWNAVNLGKNEDTSVDNKNMVYFLGWNFSCNDGGQLKNWILVPYINRSPNMDGIVSNSKDLRNQLINRMNAYFKRSKEIKNLRSISASALPIESKMDSDVLSVIPVIDLYKIIYLLQNRLLQQRKMVRKIKPMHSLKLYVKLK